MGIHESVAHTWLKPFSASAAGAADRRTLVHAEQVRACYRTIPESCIGSAFAGVILSLSMYRRVESGIVVPWFLSLCGALTLLIAA
jgi:hypothetical protein